MTDIKNITNLIDHYTEILDAGQIPEQRAYQNILGEYLATMNIKPDASDIRKYCESLTAWQNQFEDPNHLITGTDEKAIQTQLKQLAGRAQLTFKFNEMVKNNETTYNIIIKIKGYIQEGFLDPIATEAIGIYVKNAAGSLGTNKYRWCEGFLQALFRIVKQRTF